MENRVQTLKSNAGLGGITLSHSALRTVRVHLRGSQSFRPAQRSKYTFEISSEHAFAFNQGWD